jgi:hypothetical protein
VVAAAADTIRYVYTFSSVLCTGGFTRLMIGCRRRRHRSVLLHSTSGRNKVAVPKGTPPKKKRTTRIEKNQGNNNKKTQDKRIASATMRIVDLNGNTSESYVSALMVCSHHIDQLRKRNDKDFLPFSFEMAKKTGDAGNIILTVMSAIQPWRNIAILLLRI